MLGVDSGDGERRDDDARHDADAGVEHSIQRDPGRQVP